MIDLSAKHKKISFRRLLSVVYVARKVDKTMSPSLTMIHNSENALLPAMPLLFLLFCYGKAAINIANRKSTLTDEAIKTSKELLIVFLLPQKDEIN